MKKGIIYTVIGALGIIATFKTINEDKSHIIGGYTYSSPLTEHEIIVISIGIISVISLIIGLIKINKERNKR